MKPVGRILLAPLVDFPSTRECVVYVADEVVLITRMIGVHRKLLRLLATDYTHIQAENKNKGALRTLIS